MNFCLLFKLKETSSGSVWKLYIILAVGRIHILDVGEMIMQCDFLLLCWL